MAVTFFWRCEGETLDPTHDFSAGDTTATASGSPAIDAAAARVGSNGVLTNAVETYRFDPASIWSHLVGSFAFSVRFVTAIQNGGKFFRVRGANDNDCIECVVVNSDEVRFQIRHNTGGLLSLDTTSVNLVPDVWYGIVCRYDIANDSRSVSVYDASNALIQTVSDTTTDLSANGPADLNQADGFRIGDVAGVNAIHFDNVLVADAYAEPLENYLTLSSYTAINGIQNGPKLHMVRGNLRLN